VPDRQVVRISTRETEVTSRGEYLAGIETPIANWLARHRLQDQVLFIVLTKGVPLRVEGTGGLVGTTASVDSELTLLYRKMTGALVSIPGRIDNPYFLGDRPVAEARRFSRDTSDLYLVTRLDGFATDDVRRLIERGANPAKAGRIVLDQKATGTDAGGDRWLGTAADRLAAMGHGDRVLLETTRALAATADTVMGYFSWGSNDPANQRRQTGLSFSNGAIGGMFVSTDGRTLREPDPSWRPAPAGSTTGGQSLAGDLIREGITGTAGHVTEPFLDAIVRPQILVPAYLSGFTLAESYYLAMPFLSWQNLVIGDPLCAPFGAGGAAPVSSPPIDPETGLPARFAERTLAAMRPASLNLEAVKLFLRAQSARAQDRPEGEVQALLARAAEAEPRLAAAHLLLASAAESRGDVDEAMARYRAVLAAEPNNILALNNLAWALADRRNAAAEALPLAERAYRLSGQAPVVGDTLGWVRFKLGDAKAAALVLDQAARQEPANIDLLVHAATVHAALNDLVKARTYLESALKADPRAAERADVKALRDKIR
jgi:uncharacterized protein (TIGR03790 family)